MISDERLAEIRGHIDWINRPCCPPEPGQMLRDLLVAYVELRSKTEVLRDALDMANNVSRLWKERAELAENSVKTVRSDLDLTRDMLKDSMKRRH